MQRQSTSQTLRDSLWIFLSWRREESLREGSRDVTDMRGEAGPKAADREARLLLDVMPFGPDACPCTAASGMEDLGWPPRLCVDVVVQMVCMVSWEAEQAPCGSRLLE